MQRKKPKVSAPAEFEIGDDVDLAEEVVVDVNGRRVDQAYVDDVVETFHRRPGRPGLSTAAGRSPAVSFRLPASIREQAERTAAASGISVSKLARDALVERLAAPDTEVAASIERTMRSIDKTVSDPATDKLAQTAMAQLTQPIEELLRKNMSVQMDQFREQLAAAVARNPKLKESFAKLVETVNKSSSD